MDFTLSEEQVAMVDAMRSLLARECPTSLVRAHMTDRSAHESLWSHLSSWTDVSRASVVDTCLVLVELGAVCAPGPFLADALAAPVIGGDRLGTLALPGSLVPDVDVVDVVVFGGGRVADASSVTARPVDVVDSSRRLFDVDGVGDSDGRELATRAYVLVAAELVGTVRTLLDMTIAYARERVQFDRPIGSFQAVQHKLADVAHDRERAEAAVFYAAMCVDAGDADAARAAHVAKAAAGVAARRAAKDAVQIHGGIGFTWEHDLHLFVRRAYASEFLFGSSQWHHDRLGEMLCA
jgi:alkylation response protein AidB-like acyl-CoA dehydrogenase